MAEEEKRRRPSRLQGQRRPGQPTRDERLAAAAHTLAGHVLTLRLLSETLSASATPSQREALRLLGQMVECQAELVRELGALSWLEPKSARPGRTRRG